MNKALIHFVVFSLVAFAIFGFKLPPKKVDISRFCPIERSQYESTCYSYAVVYTALTTEYNIKHNITDTNEVNKNYLSSGVVASYHNSKLPLLKRSRKCGKRGTSTKSLDILKSVGTTMGAQYDCDCKSYTRIQEEVKASDKFYKISGYKTLEINNKYSENGVNWIKDALDNNHPVIIGVYQNTHVRGIKTPHITDELPDHETMQYVAKYSKNGVSDHVVCILGYDDNFKDGKGYFLIKNNYTSWGKNGGFSWIPYTFMMPLIHNAQYIEGIVE